MAFYYGGILEGIMAVDARKTAADDRRINQERYDREQARADERWALTQEQFNFTKDAAADQKRMNLLEMAIKYANKNAKSFTDGNYKVASSGGKSVDTVEQSLEQLKQFGIPDEVISKVAGGGAGDLAKIVTAFTQAKEEHLKEYGEVNPMPNEMFVEALKNAVITQPEGYKVDVDAVLEQFGITASETERLMFPPNVTPRQQIDLKAGALNIVPALSFKDLDDATKAVGMEVIRTAYGELENLRGAPEAEDTQINTWRAARIAQIESGLSKAQGDVPILTDLFGLFGNSYASQYISSCRYCS